MENKAVSELSSAFWPGLLVALIIAVSLSGIADHDLWTPDEPREAAIALDMSRTGNLIIPELAGQPFVEKPPLFYIIASFFLVVLGKIIGNTTALRLVSACFGLGTLLFTYLLGKIYFGRQKALIAAAILATMIGFIHVTHWLLVDNALMFFIIASIWALARAYPDLSESRDNRPVFLPLAGMFAAGAFLTKGLIGPLIIFFAWLGLFIPWVESFRQGRHLSPQVGRTLWVSRSSSDGSAGTPRPTILKFPFLKLILHNSVLGYHALGLLIAILFSSAWITAFALKGGPELFRAWWWTNHFGRFTGAAHDLGHISPWYYYLFVMPVYLLPWIVPVIVAIIIFLKKTFRRETMPAGAWLLIFWTLGTFLLLSLSATKRDIYLSALLPACALLGVHGIDGMSGRTAKIGEKIYWIWMFLLLIVLTAFIAAPLVKSGLFGLSFQFGWRQILALAVILISALIFSRIRTPFLQRFLIVATLGYATLLIIICPLVDRYKSYGPAFTAAADAIKAHPKLKIAGWNLDETTVAGLYYYCDLVLPAISDRQMLDDILIGKNTRFNGVLTLVKNASSKDLPDERNQVIFESRMGKRRLLQLITAPDWQKKGTKARQESEVSSQ